MDCYLIDRNVIALMKHANEGNIHPDEKKMLYDIRKVDRKNSIFSIMLACIEGGIGQRQTPEQFSKNIQNDGAIVRRFLQKARCDEDIMNNIGEFAIKLSKIIEEELVSTYEIFLKEVNDILVNSVKKIYCISECRKILAIAKDLKIDLFHPVVIASLASVCGCNEAKGILKPKKNIDNVNTYNAINDIMVFSRMGSFKAINKFDKNNIKFKFITLDKSLNYFLDNLKIIDANSKPSIFGTNMETITTFRPNKKIFPNLNKDQFLELITYSKKINSV